MLAPHHTRLLKKIKKRKVIRTVKANKDLDYLYENGYIEMPVYDKPGDYYVQPYLTEKGKAKLHATKKQTAEKWIPIVISLIALIKSFMPEIILLTKQLLQLMKLLLK